MTSFLGVVVDGRLAGPVAHRVGELVSGRAWTFSGIESYLTTELPRFRPESGADEMSLTRMRRFLAHLGDPQEKVRVVHVAGSAGKGSVASSISWVLRFHGFTVGTHLSPHVYDLRERFMVNGELPSDDDVTSVFPAVVEAIERTNADGRGLPSFFEATNGLMFHLFATLGLDRSVIEVDLGGRFDSTNVIRRRDKLAVVTRLALDHAEILGPTIEDIARHKAGILPKAGRAVVLRQPDPAANRVLAQVANERRCDVVWVDPASEGRGAWRSHTEANRALAMNAAALEIERSGMVFDPVLAARATAESPLPGRFEERAAGRHNVILDGAHNPAKVAALVSTLEERYPCHRFVCVLGLLATKDAEAVLGALAEAVDELVLTQFVAPGRGADALSAEPAALATMARAAGLGRVVVVPEPIEALTRALELASDGDPVLVAGSFRLVAAVDKHPALSPNRPVERAEDGGGASDTRADLVVDQTAPTHRRRLAH